MGYIGNKMSVNAWNAHQSGEKTWSEWRKDDFICLFSEELQPLAKKLTLNELKCQLLTATGWHHTGKYFNKTSFFEIDDDALAELTAENIDNIIANRPKRERRVPKAKGKPLFITAKIRYIEWEGRFANYKRPVEHIEIVQFMSNEKMVTVSGYNKKRLSSVEILEKIEQKTKFADINRLK